MTRQVLGGNSSLGNDKGSIDNVGHRVDSEEGNRWAANTESLKMMFVKLTFDTLHLSFVSHYIYSYLEFFKK